MGCWGHMVPASPGPGSWALEPCALLFPEDAGTGSWVQGMVVEGEGVSIRERNRVNKVTPSQVNSLADGTPHARLWAQMELPSSPITS